MQIINEVWSWDKINLEQFINEKNYPLSCFIFLKTKILLTN